MVFVFEGTGTAPGKGLQQKMPGRATNHTFSIIGIPSAAENVGDFVFSSRIAEHVGTS